MRNALVLTTYWVGVIVFAYLIAFGGVRGVETPVPVSARAVEPTVSFYAESGEQYSLSYPVAWALGEIDERTVLVDPSGQVEVSVFLVAQAIPEVALLEALGIMAESCEPGGIPAHDVAPAGDVERAVRIDGPVTEKSTSYAIGHLHGDQTLVLLVEGRPEAVDTLEADLDQIAAALSIPAASPPEPEEPAPPVVEL